MSRARRHIAAVLAAALMMQWAAANPPVAMADVRQGAPIALTDATVHTVSGPTLEHATVVMSGGKIVAVGTDAVVPAGSIVVPCTGKHIYPGMISPHTSLGLLEVDSVLGTDDAHEVGSINPNVRAEVEFNPDSDKLAVTRLNGVTSALIMAGGGTLNGTSALMHLEGWTQEDMTVRAPVGLHIQWPNMTPVHSSNPTADEERNKQRTQAIQQIKDAFDDARAYMKAHAAEGQAGIPRHDGDVKWDAMIKALRGEIPVFITASSLNQIRAALKFCDEQGLTRIVLMDASDADRIADELRARHVAVISETTLLLPQRSYEPYDIEMGAPARLYQAGIPFCISDGGAAADGNGANARNLPYNASMAAAYGLPRDEALKAVTLYPAQILGVGDQLGSIEIGKIADLIVTNGDPLEIATTIEQVYINGHLCSMETRQTRLFRKYDNRPRGINARPR